MKQDISVKKCEEEVRSAFQGLKEITCRQGVSDKNTE